MKKLLILIGGVLALAACSDDANEIDGIKAPDNAENSGSNYTIYTDTGSGAYKSPWDFNNTEPVGYFFESGLAENHGVYVRITPYIGLAYYDGADDGIYNTPNGSFNLTTGMYPNLYAAGGSEYGNYVQANPIVLANDSPSWFTHELAIFSKEDHCPLINVNIGINFNLQVVDFNIINNDLVQPVAHLGYAITPAPPAGTNAEEILLAQYGKVFYYKIEFGTSTTNFTETYYALALEAVPDNDPGEWTQLFDPSAQPLLDSFKGELHYHSNGSPTTYEIVVDAKSVIDVYPGMEKSIRNITTIGGYGIRSFETRGDNSWGWGAKMNPFGTPGKNIHIRFY